MAYTDEEKKEIYKKWHSLINMSEKALFAWAEDDNRLLASINREEAKEQGDIQSGYDSFHRIKRRKKKPFKDWSTEDFDNAKQENGFNSRMLGGKPGQPVGDSGMSKWEISLRNWGHDPSLKSSPQYEKWKSWKDSHTKKDSGMKKEACVIATTTLNGNRVLFKNRDRNYVPELKVYHVRINGVEILYMKDEMTGWIEGINQYGIGIVNSALMVLWDEKEGSKSKAKSNILSVVGSKDADRVLHALRSKTLDEAAVKLVEYDGGIRGHTFVSDGVRARSIEHTAKHAAIVRTLPKSRTHVRSNHGDYYEDAGYTSGENQESSHLRKERAFKILTELSEKNASVDEIAPSVYIQRKDDLSSPFNIVRKTENMFTSSQVVFDLANRKMILYLIPDECDFLGYEKKIAGECVCQLDVRRFSFIDQETGGFDVVPIRWNPVRVASQYMKLKK